MKIPNKIRAFGCNVSVQLTGAVNIGDRNSGSFQGWERLIKVSNDPDFPEDAQAETFLHEIFELINKELELNLEHPKIVALSVGLFGIIRDSKLDFREGKK